MFKEMGQLASLMKNLPKLREGMDKFQDRLAQILVEGDAGAGMVKVQVNGQLELVKCQIQEVALKDREMLEDLIVAATNQALTKAKQTVAEESAKITSSLGLPGFGFPS